MVAAPSEDSILKSTKHMLGLDTEYDVFDLDIVTYLNVAFNTLHQLKIGPANGFSIIDGTSKWEEFIGNDYLQAVRGLVVMKVRLMFDPPSSSFALDSMKKLVEEQEWRLNVQMEGVNPWPVPVTSLPITESSE